MNREGKRALPFSVPVMVFHRSSQASCSVPA